ncbi:uclacyanin-3-like [Oryza brachyantha]|uniref:uclacyanin-3-like n=1 Tax=Oryza brachyantha TaxID=4533 RepID=UPI00077654BA|nr:uclacyanin-3-like [Oryza brachyantha]
MHIASLALFIQRRSISSSVKRARYILSHTFGDNHLATKPPRCDQCCYLSNMLSDFPCLVFSWCNSLPESSSQVQHTVRCILRKSESDPDRSVHLLLILMMAMVSAGASCLGMVALLLVACASSAAATSYTVGDASGWTTGVDYTSWAGSKPFKVGDSLVFKYASGAHTVVEVSAAGYLACAAANALGSDSSGSTTVALKTAGKHYFICSIPGHCAGGMKMEVDVSGSSGGGGGSTPSSPTPTTPNPSTPTPTMPNPSTPTPTTPYPSTPTPTTPYPSNPTPTTPYTTPTTPSCPGGAGVTPVTPGTTPFMSYNGAAGLGPVALATIGMVCIAVFVQLGLL